MPGRFVRHEAPNRGRAREWIEKVGGGELVTADPRVGQVRLDNDAALAISDLGNGTGRITGGCGGPFQVLVNGAVVDVSNDGSFPLSPAALIVGRDRCGTVVRFTAKDWAIPPLAWFPLSPLVPEPLVLQAPQFVSGGLSQWNTSDAISGVFLAEGAYWGLSLSHGVPPAGNELTPGLKGVKVVASTVYLQIYASRLSDGKPYAIGVYGNTPISFAWSSPAALPNGGAVASVAGAPESTLSRAICLIMRQGSQVLYALPKR